MAEILQHLDAGAMIASVNRAAVLIGVNRTGGGLPVLRKAADSARRMEAWALAQGLHRDHVRVFTDEKKQPVRIAPIQDAIRELVELTTIDQLIVFFAGHGINVNRTERWLLTDAPGNPQAAVNMAGSAALAAFCNIPHVVMISDACRTAAHTIQTQFVTGSEIFPNEEDSDLELPVDQFWACALGRPSHEIRETAIFTRALLTALEDFDSGAADSHGYVRPRPLKLFLQQEVPRQLQKRRLHTKLIQVPDAHIASDEHAWISELSLPPPPLAATGPPPSSDATLPESAAASSPSQSFAKGLYAWLRQGTSQRLDPNWSRLLTPILALILSGRLDVVGDLASDVHDQPEVIEIINSVEASRRPSGPAHYETRCGFKLRGASLRRVNAGAVRAEQLNDELVRIHLAERRSGNVLLELDDGYGIALPAISGFITSLTIDDGELVEVAYEPSENTSRWEEFIQRADEVRALRAFAASSAREGVFHLDGDSAVQVARRMQYSKGVDPALAVYAAYTYADNGRRDLIRRMSRYMYDDLGAVLFDLALLAREQDRSYLTSSNELLGFAPLFAQGWALLAGSQLTIPNSLADLQRHVVPESLWTLYDQTGVRRIRDAFAIGELR